MDNKVTHGPEDTRRIEPEISEDSAGSREMQRGVAACLDFISCCVMSVYSEFKERFSCLSGTSSAFETKKEDMVIEENVSISLTSGQDSNNNRPSTRLTDFVVYDKDGIPRPFESFEDEDLYISGRIVSLDERADQEKESEIGCEDSRRIKSWAISGYDKDYPVVCISTDVADYDCLEPASSYKIFYGHFYDKAYACIKVFQKLSKSSGGNPNLSLDELLDAVGHSMTQSKSIPVGLSVKDFVVFQGEFIYNQLLCLDEISKNNDQIFSELPVLVALRDESRKNVVSNSDIKNTGEKFDQSSSSTCTVEEEKDVNLVLPYRVGKYWQRMKQMIREQKKMKQTKQKKCQHPTLASNKLYFMINEVEIANDYPLPRYYKTAVEEIDERLLFDRGISMCDSDEAPKFTLHNWALYNYDSRLISLELLPMTSCAENNVTTYGSGIMTADDESEFCVESYSIDSSSSALGDWNVDGIPIFLSPIKEWAIEFRSSTPFISIRTDMAWYRLGKPSKQYVPWCKPVLKTAKLATSIVTLLTKQNQVSPLSFEDVIKRVSEFEKDHPAYISSNLAEVEKYVVVHGQIILQQFAEYPDEIISKFAFLSGLTDKIEERHSAKQLLKKLMLKSDAMLNPRAAMVPVVPRKLMKATTTRLIYRIWWEYYSNYSREYSKEGNSCDTKEEEDVEEQDKNEDVKEFEEEMLQQKTPEPPPTLKPTKLRSTSNEVQWSGESIGNTCSGEALYKRATVRGEVISVGGVVVLEVDGSEEIPAVYFVEYMIEKSDARKMVHGRLMQVGSHTILGNAANEREVFLTNECLDFELENVKLNVVVNIRSMPWGHQHRKDNANKDETDRETAKERKRKGLPTEYYCKSLYQSERGAFCALPFDIMGKGDGVCYSCKIKEAQKEKETFKVDSSMTGFMYKGTEYNVHDFVYVTPKHFVKDREDHGTSKDGKNVGFKAYVVCQLLEIDAAKAYKPADPESIQVKVRRFFRPEDISPEYAYSSDIREVFYSEQILSLPVRTIEGKCEVRNDHSLLSPVGLAIFEHVFFCKYTYDPATGSIKKWPPDPRSSFSIGKAISDAISSYKKGKSIEEEEESDFDIDEQEAPHKNWLATLDIFAGCGGLSTGLQQSGISLTKWAIEYDEPTGEAFETNHRDIWMFLDDCNVVLRAIMEKCGDVSDCVSASEVNELAEKLGEEKIKNLPLPGNVDFIIGGPPCQEISRLNKFNQSTWDKVQCETILTFLSFADYFRPKFLLLENVKNFVSLNKGETFCLTLASLLEMGYQVRFGILEAGAYGVSQSQKRMFIWAASPEEVLPEWPEPMHVIAADPELKIPFPGYMQYDMVQSRANGAPFRSINVRDTIGDLPAVANGVCTTFRNVLISMPHQSRPVSWFQKKVRGKETYLSEHISKKLNELNFIRCQYIPKVPGADWHCLRDAKVSFRSGQVVDLIPWWLPDTAKANKQWKGLFGRLDWEGNFPTSTANPQPMGKVGMCFHPEQDRIVTVRECARSQGFMDIYEFSGDINDRYKQIGNAVPPPLAFALGKKLIEALDQKQCFQQFVYL